MIRLLSFLLLAFFLNVVMANTSDVDVKMFISSTCPHCQGADKLVQRLKEEFPWLIVHRYVVDKDKAGLSHFHEQLRPFQSDDYSVPSLFFCGSRWTGFENDVYTGDKWRKALQYCHQQLLKDKHITTATSHVLGRWSESYELEGSTRKISQHMYAMWWIAPIIDAFGVNAFFAFAVFLAIMWLSVYRYNRGITTIVMITALWLTHLLEHVWPAGFYWQVEQRSVLSFCTACILFLSVCTLRAPLVFFEKYRWFMYVNKYAHLLFYPFVFFIMVMLVRYQKMPAADISVFFEQFLKQNDGSFFQNVMYLIAYQGLYILPMVAASVLFYCVMKSRKIKRFYSLLDTAANAILVIVASIFLIQPTVLAHVLPSVFMVVFALLIGYLIMKRTEWLNEPI